MNVAIHGYAIVSADDRIAGPDGATPASLRNAADWAYFQAGLDRARLTVLGRLGHEANPNRKGRPRLILSSSVHGLERRGDGWWWNPQALDWDAAIAEILPEGGEVAVPGGRRVFDLFLQIGYAAFHLSRAPRVTIGAGQPLFSAGLAGEPAEASLRRHGLRPGPETMLDEQAPVTLTVWR